MIKFCHHLTKPIIARIIVSLVFKNIIVRAAVLFSEILCRNKFWYLPHPPLENLMVRPLYC